MNQVVYADILFVTNVLITYLLVSLVASIFKVKRNIVRMLFSSALGGVFSFYILAPEQHPIINVFIKLSFSAAIIFAGFKIRSTKHFMKMLLCFYVVSFSFAGIMMAIWILVKPSGMVINNSTVYFNISVPLLLLSCAACYAVIWIAQRVIAKRVPNNSACDLIVRLGENSVSCRGIVDTGNNLTDLFTGCPVIIADYNSVERLIPHTYRAFYSERGALPEALDSFSDRVRTIPYEVVGGRGILPSFRPDYIVICSRSKKVKLENVIVAVSTISQKEYQVLLNSSMGEFC